MAIFKGVEIKRDGNRMSRKKERSARCKLKAIAALRNAEKNKGKRK